MPAKLDGVMQHSKDEAKITQQVCEKLITSLLLKLLNHGCLEIILC